MQEAKPQEESHKKSFIETEKFPLSLVSQASSREKQGGGRPDYWEMVFWWTRKPLISARAVIAGCLLPSNIEEKEFIRALRLDQKVPHRFNPDIPDQWKPYFLNKSLLDPFAGFGSIPLEALRLGLTANAVELLPTAYVFLKTVLDYPLRYGKPLLKDIEKWGDWIEEELKRDRDLAHLYEGDTAVYIGTWEIVCPHCKNWTPVIGNYWLARQKNSDQKYDRLAWFYLKKNRQSLDVVIQDLNKEFESVTDATLNGRVVDIKGQTFNVPNSNIDSKSEKATCLRCESVIRYIDPLTGKHYLDKKKLPKDVSERLEWHVKRSIILYNQGHKDAARYRMLIQVKPMKGDLKFVPCTEKDDVSLTDAQKLLDTLVQNNSFEIPNESFAPYKWRHGNPSNWGFDTPSKLYNPRQMIALTKLTNLIRQVGRKIENESSASKSTFVFEYSEALTSYFALALCKLANYNSIVNRWDSTWWKIGETLSTRGISINWNWCDINPNSGFIGSWRKCLDSVINGLKYLESGVSNENLASTEISDPKIERINVILDDATVLSKLEQGKKFDLIITDPPYYDDVMYTELSDFYYVWLKRALSEIGEKGASPRYLREAFFRKIGGQWLERKTQWENFATREVSLHPPRLGHASSFDADQIYFQNLLDASFMSMKSMLANGGTLVTYYAHTDPEAWKALLRSGWESSALTVSNALPITTESGTSVVSRGKLALDTSIVVVWKGEAKGSINAADLFESMIQVTQSRMRSSIDMKMLGRDLFVGALVSALSEATKYREILEMKKLDTNELMDKYVLRASLYGLTRAISEKANVEEGIKTGESIFYLVAKFLYSGSQKKSLTSDDARILSLGTGIELSYSINVLKMFRAGGQDEEDEGSSLAKRKTLILIDPQGADKSKLKDLLDYREIDPESPKLRCSVDALHLLEYYAIAYGMREFGERVSKLQMKYPTEVEEGIALARVLAAVLSDDLEHSLSELVVDRTFTASQGSSDYTDLRSYSGGQ